MASGENSRAILDHPELAGEFVALAQRTEQDCDEETVERCHAGNTELKDLFEPDEDDTTRDER